MENKLFTSISLNSVKNEIPLNQFSDLHKQAQDFYNANKTLTGSEYREKFTAEFGHVIELYARILLYKKIDFIKNAALFFVILAALSLLGSLILILRLNA